MTIDDVDNKLVMIMATMMMRMIFAWISQAQTGNGTLLIKVSLMRKDLLTNQNQCTSNIQNYFSSLKYHCTQSFIRNHASNYRMISSSTFLTLVLLAEKSCLCQINCLRKV